MTIEIEKFKNLCLLNDVEDIAELYVWHNLLRKGIRTQDPLHERFYAEAHRQGILTENGELSDSRVWDLSECPANTRCIIAQRGAEWMCRTDPRTKSLFFSVRASLEKAKRLEACAQALAASLQGSSHEVQAKGLAPAECHVFVRALPKGFLRTQAGFGHCDESRFAAKPGQNDRMYVSRKRPQQTLSLRFGADGDATPLTVDREDPVIATVEAPLSLEDFPALRGACLSGDPKDVAELVHWITRMRFGEALRTPLNTHFFEAAALEKLTDAQGCPLGPLDFDWAGYDASILNQASLLVLKADRLEEHPWKCHSHVSLSSRGVTAAFRESWMALKQELGQPNEPGSEAEATWDFEIVAFYAVGEGPERSPL